MEQNWSRKFLLVIFCKLPIYDCPVNLYSILEQVTKIMINSYRPITKEDAAQILSVSKRTIDNWLADGTIVEPKAIGRRLYWHPDIFYAWLNERLGVSSGQSPSVSPPQAVQPKRTGRPRATLH